MYIIFLIIGLITGIILNYVNGCICYSISKTKNSSVNLWIPVICGILFEIVYLQYGVTVLSVKAMVMAVILLSISFIDLRYRIIPDYLVIAALITGMAFAFITKASLIDTVFGMICGGGVLFLISLLPNAMGGGDIKLMFAIGAFLGVNKVIWALLFAFVLSSVVSIALILFKIKGTKDYIPFGPFLAFGSLLSLLIFI